ncbi:MULTISPECIES: DUF6879 family protein [unclassified Frankia]|uniref:DUF6879 family protein n=1 Tax=unclassified Frankia TaxID=2632575 RepID=UPI002AD2CE69|nr:MULTISPECIES: DUF6879 family protein [unclassified Frankia]
MNNEIQPPAWALAGATRLNLEEFGKEFIRYWRDVRSRVLKFECWQTYQEPDTRSLHEYQHGNFDVVQSLLEGEAEFDREVYEDVKKKSIQFIRVRLVKLPLSEYLMFEIWNYVVRSRLGESIEIVDLSDDGRPLPNHSYFDFLLFDATAALVHDYGTDGLQVGGWLTTSSDALKRLKAMGERVRLESIPLDDFTAKQSIEIPPRG